MACRTCAHATTTQALCKGNDFIFTTNKKCIVFATMHFFRLKYFCLSSRRRLFVPAVGASLVCGKAVDGGVPACLRERR